MPSRLDKKKFQPRDGHATPKTSPLTVSGTEIAITVPKGATEMVYLIRDADMKISDITGLADYALILDGNGDTLYCAGMDYIYVIRNAAVDVKLHFYFNIIN